MAHQQLSDLVRMRSQHLSIPSLGAAASAVASSTALSSSHPIHFHLPITSDLPTRFAAAHYQTAKSTVATTLFLIRGGGGSFFGSDAPPDLDLTRVAFRLEGMEIYSLVMALFMGAAITLLYSTPVKIYSVEECKRNKRKAMDTVATLAFQICCTYAVVSSGFVTILFTLTSLYCKTAVGMGTDSRYLEFLSATGHIRYGGFRAFMNAIRTFGLSFILSMFLCGETQISRWLGMLIPALATYKFSGLINSLVAEAGRIIFAPASK